MIIENRCDRTDHNLIFWFQIFYVVFRFIFTDPFFDKWNVVKVDIIQGNIADLIRGLTFTLHVRNIVRNIINIIIYVTNYLTLALMCIIQIQFGKRSFFP